MVDGEHISRKTIAAFRVFIRRITFTVDTEKKIFQILRSMEIERKYLIKKLPEDLAQYPHMEMEQAYLCTEPVVRVRKEGADYVLTYKSKGLMVREEYNLPLTKESYEHLLEKADGTVITKTRYRIPEKNGLTIELDVFHGRYGGLLLAEVEFATEEEANSYCPPEWFGEDVTMSSAYHNSTLSQKK